MAGSRGVRVGRSKQVFIQFGTPPTQIATDIGSEMALDNRPLTALGASEQAASLASLPEDLWRKIASLARPPTVRALVAACPDASLRSALRTDIDRAERAAFGLTQREAERSRDPWRDRVPYVYQQTLLLFVPSQTRASATGSRSTSTRRRPTKSASSTAGRRPPRTPPNSRTTRTSTAS